VKAVVSWSSGKDSAWALWRAVDAGVEPVALVTTFHGEVATMQGTPRTLVETQARLLGLPLWAVNLPWPCPNRVYEERVAAIFGRARDAGAIHVVFGDLYLEDVRAYREELCASQGMTPLFPLWCTPEETPELAAELVEAGVEAVISCVDPRALDPGFCGEAWSPRRLPDGVDPMGEQGEFHTFCYAGPFFPSPIEFEVVSVFDRDGYRWASLQGRTT
jgi:uncharacterized protein (TIGR00290 family)